jgi:hypothetical protein
MNKTPKLFRVYDGKSYVGSYRAYTAEAAMRRAQEDQYVTGQTFRKSQPAIKFTALRAEEIAEVAS